MTSTRRALSFRPRSQARTLSVHNIYLLQSVAEQVVCAVEQTFAMDGPRKKTLALQIVRDIFRDEGIFFTRQVLEVAVEAAVRVMNLLERGN